MTKGTKLCPFHEEAIMPDLFSGSEKDAGGLGIGGYWARIDCPECGNGFIVDAAATEEEAVNRVTAMWNTRYRER